LTVFFFNKLLLLSYDAEGKVGSAFRMEQQVVRFREFIIWGNFASAGNMCRAAVFIMEVLIVCGVMGTGHVYGGSWWWRLESWTKSPD